VAWAAKEIGLKAVIFEPVYSKNNEREDMSVLKKHKERWVHFGAEVIPLPAGRAKVNFYSGSKILKDNYSNSIMLPLGLPLKETIDETAKIAKKTESELKFDTVVVNVGSGTICAGLLKGFSKNIVVYGVMGRTGDVQAKKKRIVFSLNIFLYFIL